MDIISRKYINEGFNSKAYIINDDYILLDGVNQNSYKNYQKYVNVINQISNVKSFVGAGRSRPYFVGSI